MSDGPHRSLPMRKGWKRLAEWGDNQAFAAQHVSEAIVPALEGDCREEVTSEFLDAFARTYGSLFNDESQLEALRPLAGSGIGRVILDHAIQLAANGETGIEAAIKAVKNALTDRGARGARSVEEHFYRESTKTRALRVRARIEEGISSAGPAIESFARKLLGMEPRKQAKSLKQQGLDDGVVL